MIFVWSEHARFVAGAGGTENHTLERAREMQRLGKSVEIIFLSEASYDPGFSDIAYRFISAADELSYIDDTIVYIARGQNVATIQKSYLFLHFPISHADLHAEQLFKIAALRSNLITNSKHSRRYWAKALDVHTDTISVVYPFAHPVFSTVQPQRAGTTCKVLYPNRITPEKGLFVFLEATYVLNSPKEYEFIILGAGNHTPMGKQTEAWLRHVSTITYTEPAVSCGDMALHYASASIVVLPARSDYWQEPFGMTSVEGQHSGCRVIASDSGGLRETDCGLLDLVEAGNAYKLAQLIAKIARRGPVNDAERVKAAQHFTLQKSVESFLDVTGDR